MKLEIRAFHGPVDWAWVNQQVPILRVEDTTGLMAVDVETNETVGACVLDNWTNNSVQAHLMITSPLVIKHKFLQYIGEYLYGECGLKYIYALVPGDNEKALRLDKHMGFRELLRMPDAWEDGIDIVVLVMTAEECNVYTPQALGEESNGEKVEQSA